MITNTVPIDIRTNGGSITYRYKTPDYPVGVFSFTYYYRHEPTKANRNAGDPGFREKLMVYVNGITAYLRLTTRKEFSGWKIVIYTDPATLADIKKLPILNEKIQAILTHPNTIVAESIWKEYSSNPYKIDGPILRVFRHKALMDFADIPVCVRDADTYFINDMPANTSDSRFEEFVERLAIWERLLLENMIKSGRQFLVAGVPEYSRVWHKNTLADFGSTGLLAGLVNSYGGIKEWASGELWQETVDFIQRRCSMVATNRGHYEISNIWDKTYVGKDEQVMIFVWIPKLLERTFFFYFDFSEVFSNGNFINSWANLKKYNHTTGKFTRKTTPFKPALEQLISEYPMLVNRRNGNDIAFNNYYLESPYSKLLSFRLDMIKPPHSPLPGEKPTTKAEYRELVEEKFDDIVSQGKLSADNPIRDYVDIDTDKMSRLNLYIVSEAFRNPIYNRIMTLLFENIRTRYQLACKISAVGGRTRRKRHLRKNISMRRHQV